MLKATWNGEGQPEGGVLEYGAGTENPTIPLGVLRQRKDPDSNWTFEYVPQAPSTNQIYSYLSQPVWFYTSADGSSFYAERESQIPPDAQGVKKGKYADVYKLTSTTQRAGQGLIASEHDKLKTDRVLVKQAQVIEKLRNTRVTLRDPKKAFASIFEMKKTKTAGEGFSVLPLYLMAMKTGNSYLMDRLEAWIPQSGTLQLSSGDLFDNDRVMSDGMARVSGVDTVEKILSTHSWDDLNKVMAVYYAFVAEKNAPPEKEAAPPPPPKAAVERPLPAVLQPPPLPEAPKPQPVPEPAKTQPIAFVPARLEDFQVSTSFSRKYSALEIGRGQHYIKNIPDEILEAAFMTLPARSKDVLSTYMPGFFKKERSASGQHTGGYMLVGKPARTFEGNSPVMASEQLELMEALGVFESALSKSNPELCISNAATNYSPLFTLQFPFMAQLGSDSEDAFAAMQGGFRFALKEEMKKSPDVYEDFLSDMEGDIFGHVNLGDIEDKSIITRALTNMWQYQSATDSSGNTVKTPLGVMVDRLVEKTALRPEEVVSKMQTTLKGNFQELSFLKDRTSHAQGMFGGRGMSSAGRALGMLVSHFTGGIGARAYDKQAQNFMHLPQAQLGPALEKLLGQRVEVSLGDTVTYTPSSGGQSRSFSLGLMHYMHNFLPYHLNSSGELIADIAGQEYNLDKVQGTDRDQLVDLLMEEISNKCSMRAYEPLDGQSAIYNSLKKYQESIFADEKMRGDVTKAFGEKKPLSQLKEEDNVHHNVDVLQQANSTVSSLVNYLFSDLENFIIGKETPEGLAEFDGDKARYLDYVLLKKQQEISSQAQEVSESFGIPISYSMEFASIVDAAIENTREEAVRLFSAKGKLPTSVFGNLSEQLQTLVPAASVIRYHHLRGEKVEFETGDRGYIHKNLNVNSMSRTADPEGQVRSGFLKSYLPMAGFKYTVNGKENFIVKEGRPGGFGDLLHIEDPTGDAVIHTFEGKNFKLDKVDYPHISQTSQFTRTALQATRSARSIRIGKVSTLQTSYGWTEEAKTPLGLAQSKKGKAKFSFAKYGIPKQGSADVNYTALMDVFSSNDGPGLAAVGVR